MPRRSLRLAETHFARGMLIRRTTSVPSPRGSNLPTIRPLPACGAIGLRFRIGTAYEKLNQSDAALDAYYTVIARGPQASKSGNEPEYFGDYKSGFEGRKVAGKAQALKEAIAVYEKSPRWTARAPARPPSESKLRLEEFHLED